MAAFTLFGALEGVNQSFDNTVSRLGAISDRLFVASRVSRDDQLPIAYLSRLENLPGVAIATQSTSFRAYFQEPGQWIGGYAINPARHFRVYSEYRIPQGQVEQMQRIRTAAIIGRKLAEKYGWTIGSRIPLHSHWAQQNGSFDWAFDVVGTYHTADASDEENLFINFEYFDTARAFSRGTATHLIVRAQPGANPPAVCAQIDRLFANSSDETLTQNERDLVRNRMRQLGDVSFFVKTIIGTALFTLLMLTVNVMRQSIDERLVDFATLKALGFNEPQITLLILAECCLLMVSGAAVGLLAAAGVVQMLPNQLKVATVPWQTPSWAALYAFGLGVASALVPVFRVRRITIARVLAGA